MQNLRKTILPVLAAMIWGSAFVAQSKGAELMPPFAFNTVRSIIATLALLVVAIVFAALRKEPLLPPKGQRKNLWLGGLCCGGVLAIASALQQAGLHYTDPGKAGFITALYIVLVPIAGLLFKKRPPLTVWLAVILAAVGLYFLCVDPTQAFSIESGDLLIIGCAFCFTAHILLIDHFTKTVDGVRLSLVQFFFVAVFSAIFMAVAETPDWSVLPQCAVPLLYTGVLSSGVAYTLQIISQKGANPAVISLLLFLLLFTLLMIVVHLVSKMMQSINNIPVLGVFNQILGGVMGVLMAYLSLSVAVSVIDSLVTMFQVDNVLLNRDILNRSYVYRALTIFNPVNILMSIKM